MKEKYGIGDFQHQILSRYEENGRDFPWRHTRNPYAIHICEVMSQQTQLSRVLPYRTQRMNDIPDYETLSTLSKAELLKHRSGL
jgi:A/G-specific adenine glycosylase